MGDNVKVTTADGKSGRGVLSALSGQNKTASITFNGDLVDAFKDIGGLKAGTLLEAESGTTAEIAENVAEIAENVAEITVDLGPLDVGDKFDRHIAVKYHPNLLITRATYDQDGNELTPPVFGGPHLMIRLVSDIAKRKGRRIFYEADLDQDGNLVRKTMPSGIALVDDPGTVVWL